jgi:hypothetical protein
MSDSPPSTPPRTPPTNATANSSAISDGLARLQFLNDDGHGLQIYPAGEAGDSPESIAEQNVNEEDNEDAMDIDHPIESRIRSSSSSSNDIERRVRQRNDNDADNQEGQNEQENNNIVLVEMTVVEASEYKLLRPNNYSTANKPRTGGMFMLYGDKKIPCQEIENHPNGVPPLGTMLRPISKTYTVGTISGVLNDNHFNVGNNPNPSPPFQVTMWNRVNNGNNENIVFGEGRIGFVISNIDGMVELLGRTSIRGVTVDDVKNAKKYFKHNQLTPRDEEGRPCAWPIPSNISQWDYPITIYHPEGLFHGNEGGQHAAYMIQSTEPKLIAKRKRNSTIMNSFYLLNHQWEPPNRMEIDGVEFTRLRNNQGDHDENEEMWQRIESGTST